MAVTAPRGGAQAQLKRRDLVERTFSVAAEALYTVALQCRRLRSDEPEDDAFPRWWADLQFLMVVLRRLRRAAEIARSVPEHAEEVSYAVQRFDDALPGLTVMRNVGEHIDDYALQTSQCRHEVDSRALAVGHWDGTVFSWVGHELDIDVALKAAEDLYRDLHVALFDSCPCGS